jgi:hypothetical protein
MYCSKCGKPTEESNSFCASCGNAISPVTDSPPTSATATVANIKGKLNRKTVIVIIGAVCLVAVVLGIIMIPKLFSSVDDLLAQGDYEKAYATARAERKDDIVLENQIAYLSAIIVEHLFDRSSFELRDAWFDRGEQELVLRISGRNRMGGMTSSYYYYTFDNDDKEYKLYVSLSSLENEEARSSHTLAETIEMLLKNSARSTVKTIIEDSSNRVDANIVRNIQRLFNEGLLDSVSLLKVD